MGRGLSHYGRLYLAGKAGFTETLGCPVLLWEVAQGAASPAQESWMRTESGSAAHRPRLGEPLVFEVRKFPEKRNPFAMGVTVGRVDTNDIVIDDASISRFHAYLQQDARSKEWTVADAESKNGSMLNGARLPANVRSPIANLARVRFGDIELVFLTPEGLQRRIEDSFRRNA